MAKNKKQRAGRHVGRRLQSTWARERRARAFSPRVVAEVEESGHEPELQEVQQGEAPSKKMKAPRSRVKPKPKLGGRRSVSPWTRAQAVAVATPSVQPSAVPEEDTQEETLTPTVQRETTPMTMSDFMGAMPLPAQREAHTATVLVRLTPGDKRALEKLARKSKCPLAVYCRAALQWIARGQFGEKD